MWYAVLGIAAFAVWLAAMFWSAMNASEEYGWRRATWTVLAIALFILPVAYVIDTIADESAAYDQRCRAAGGFVIDRWESRKCVTSDRRYLDVE